MKALDVMMFMVAFNLMMFGLAATGILDASAPAGEELSVSTSFTETTYLGENIIGGLAFAIAAASITVLGTQVVRPVGVVVTAFAGFYGFTVVSSMRILYGLQFGGVHLVPLFIIGIFTVMNTIVFVFGMFRMVTGAGE